MASPSCCFCTTAVGSCLHAVLTPCTPPPLPHLQARYGALSAEREDGAREAGEVRRQMEEDADREVEELKER